MRQRWFIATAAFMSACGGARVEAPPRADAPPGIHRPRERAEGRAPATDASELAADSGAPTEPDQTPAASSCPPGMVHVRKDFCTEVERTCLKSSYDKPNHLTLCHEFKEEAPRCVGSRVALDFCIDEYEYPNQKGGHPPVMVSFYDASGLCAAEGKRLCYESEWTAACEGPDEKPFPAGYERSAEICNIDNRWIEPSLKKIYSSDRSVREPELARLDQSVPSGAKPRCVSDYGVHDLTGNFDEWTLADHDRPRERAVFAALKGGAWGHVRNACRPVTTSHSPDFTYYFVSLRCCADPAGAHGQGENPASKLP